MKTAIYMMLMEDQITTTQIATTSVLYQLNNDTVLFLLLNGSEDPDIVDYFEKIPHVKMFTSPVNLGVAGGRNFLLKEAVAWGAELFISLDNDILVPSNYFKIMAERLESLKENHVGIIAPACLNFGNNYELAKKIIDAREEQDNRILFTSKDIWEYLEEHDSMELRRKFYHLGVRHWFSHYLTSFPVFLTPWLRKLNHFQFISRKSTFQKMRTHFITFLGDDDKIVKKIVDAKVPHSVDSLAGGLHCYNKKYLDDIGYFDEAFSPFGYEDADFSIRGLKKGYRHFVITDTYVIHDIAKRNFTRSFPYKLLIMGKSRRLLLYKHSKNQIWYMISWLDALFFQPICIFMRLRDPRYKFQDCARALYNFLKGFFITGKRVYKAHHEVP